MKLRVEPPEARGESYSGLAPRAAECHDRVLGFVMQRQELPKWCWAAIAASLGGYYGTLRGPQHAVAAALLGFDCSRFREEPEVRARCDVYAPLDEALRVAGCYSHWSPGRPTFERIGAEIDAGRPVCVQVDWHRGGSHYMVLTGYYADSGEVYIQDPLHGPSVQTFDGFPRGYRALGGVWSGTFWTYPPPPAACQVESTAPAAREARRKRTLGQGRLRSPGRS